MRRSASQVWVVLLAGFLAAAAVLGLRAARGRTVAASPAAPAGANLPVSDSEAAGAKGRKISAMPPAPGAAASAIEQGDGRSRAATAEKSRGASDGSAHGPKLRSARLESLLEEMRANPGSDTRETALSGILASEDVSEDLQRLLAASDRDAFLLGVQALALRGTPDDVIRMVELIEGANDEDRRRDIVVTACGVRNASAVPLMFEILKTATEPEFVDIAQRALGGMSGDVLLDTVKLYRGSGSEEERERLLGVVRCTSQSNAVPLLAAIADFSKGDYSDPLTLAAVDTLAVLGSGGAVSNLLARLQLNPESSQLANAVGRVVSPDALPGLLQVATVADGQTPWAARVAAVRALGNYPAKDVQNALSSLTLLKDLPAEMKEAVNKALQKVQGQYGADFSR